MVQHSIPRIVFLAALGLALLAIPARAGGPADEPGTANFEIRFLQNMIDHHHMAIMMSELCDGRTVHPELQGLCEQIRTTQMAEVEQMHAWLMEWYGITYEPRMNPGMMRKMERLAELTGQEFEIEYMEMMIRHHEQAVQGAGHCLDRAKHQELLALCASIGETQEQEIVQMQTWLCDWYDICR